MADEEKGAIPKPTKEQIDQVVNPSLSRDSFKIGDREIPIQILPIDDEERIINIFLPAIKEIISDLPEKFTVKEITGKIDMQMISKYKKVLIETLAIMAQRHDKDVTPEIIGKGIHTAGIMKAILTQFEKNQIADMVSNFFFRMATILPKAEPKNPQSPPT